MYFLLRKVLFNRITGSLDPRNKRSSGTYFFLLKTGLLYAKVPYRTVNYNIASCFVCAWKVVTSNSMKNTDRGVSVRVMIGAVERGILRGWRNIYDE
jgi:hypothetical protein